MRLVFLFFLMLNAGYFIWQSGYFSEPAARRETDVAPPKGVATLTLLRERGLGVAEAPPRPASKPRAPTVEPVPPAPIPESAKLVPLVETEPVAATPAPDTSNQKPGITACFTFGPFDKEETLTRAWEAIVAAGGSVNRRQVEQRTPRAYWVYLPPPESYEQAQEIVKELRKKGISDLFIMGKGEKQNAVSLGLFSSKGMADQRFEEVTALGLRPVAETQYRVSAIDWLDIEVTGGDISTIATITAITDDYKTANLSQRACE